MILAKYPFWCFAKLKNIIDFNWKMATEKRVIENVENYFHELSLSQSCCLLRNVCNWFWHAVLKLLIKQLYLKTLHGKHQVEERRTEEKLNCQPSALDDWRPLGYLASLQKVENCKQGGHQKSWQLHVNFFGWIDNELTLLPLGQLLALQVSSYCATSLFR